MFAVLLLAMASLSQGVHPLAPRSQFSSITVTVGIRGGIIGPCVRRRVELGYDWEVGEYRVTIYDPARARSGGNAYRTGIVTRDWFENVLDGILERGLEELPPQPDADSQDVYGLDTGIRVVHGRLLWENRASTGCVAHRVEVPPTREECRAFAEIVSFLGEATQALDLEPATERDSDFALEIHGNAHGRIFLAAVTHALRSPFGPYIRRRQVRFHRGRNHCEVFFPIRGLELGDDVRQENFFVVLVDLRTTEASTVSTGSPYLPTAELLRRRRAYLEAHSELGHPFSYVIAEGRLKRGMTQEMVLASWGQPDDADLWTYELCGWRVQLSFDGRGRLIGGIPNTYVPRPSSDWRELRFDRRHVSPLGFR